MAALVGMAHLQNWGDGFILNFYPKVFCPQSITNFCYAKKQKAEPAVHEK